MRVLHVIPAVATRYGGPSEAIVGMCRALRAIGVDAEIATTDADGEGHLDVPHGSLTTFRDVPTRFFPRTGGEGFKRSPELARWLRSGVRGADVVHIHAVFSHASLAAASSAHDARVPYIVRPLGTLDPWSLAQKRWRKRVLLWAAAGRMLDRAAAIHFTTSAERSLAPARTHATGVVIPLGLDETAFDPRPVVPGQRERLAVTMTRLHPKKNLEALIGAFGRARGADAWRLVIAGEGEPAYTASLQALAARSGAGARITFAGWVGGDAKQALLSRAALFVLPSHQENFGIAVLEGLARGVPAIISSQVNLAADIEPAGAGWIVQDEAGLHRTLEAAMAHEVDRTRRANAARALAETFRWTAVAPMLVELYQRLSGAQGGEPRAHVSVAS